MIDLNTLQKLEFEKVLSHISKYCSTEKGKSIILNSRPFDNLNRIQQLGNRVSEAKNILIDNDIPPLSYIPDLAQTLTRSRVEGTVLSKEEILAVLNLAEISRKVFQFFRDKNEYSLKSDLTDNLFIDKVFEHHIRDVFDENGEVADRASTRLAEIRRSIKEKNDSLRKVVNHLLKKLSESALVQEEYFTQRDGRFVLPVKASFKRQVKGFIHSESATGQTVYIEPEETLELNNDILSLTFAEKREVERILRALTKKIGTVSQELAASLAILAELDSSFAAAKYSIEIIGSFPTIINNQTFEILNGRHPVLVKKLGRDKTIPLNLKIKENKIVLITGPNAGGKTVVLKTTGLLTAMVLSGFHVPVDPDSNFHYFDQIHIDIGDQQSIEEDLSTFSSHLTNIKKIIDFSDERGLVLLDEIGTGTDPAEGSALAIAILLQLYKNGSTVLATTHHGNVKLIANELEGFENASMEYDLENLNPTYKFRQGMPGSSYAFEVAERIGFSREFIGTAKEYVDTEKSKIEDFLVELEQKANDYRAKLNSAERENARLKGLANLYQEKVTKLEAQKKDIIAKTKSEAESYLNEVNSKVEAVIKNIRESNAKKEVIVSEKKTISELKEKTKKLIAPGSEKNKKSFIKKELKSGDFVKLKNTDTKGTIISIDNSKNKAILSVGSLKLQVKLFELEHSEQQEKKTESSAGRNVYSYRPEISSIRLDLRGRRPEEVDFELTKFLDDAYASGTLRVEILHGKGTGALKKTVQDLLKSSDQVKDFYPEKIEFGGDGITIVELN